MQRNDFYQKHTFHTHCSRCPGWRSKPSFLRAGSLESEYLDGCIGSVDTQIQKYRNTNTQLQVCWNGNLWKPWTRHRRLCRFQHRRHPRLCRVRGQEPLEGGATNQDWTVCRQLELVLCKKQQHQQTITNKQTGTEGRATNQDWAVCCQLSKIWFCASSKAWLWKVQFYSFLKLWQWFGSSKINDQQQHATDFPKSRLAEMGALNKYRQQMFAICISWPWPSNSWIFLRLQLSHHTFSTSQWRRKTRKNYYWD